MLKHNKTPYLSVILLLKHNKTPYLSAILFLRTQQNTVSPGLFKRYIVIKTQQNTVSPCYIAVKTQQNTVSPGISSLCPRTINDSRPSQQSRDGLLNACVFFPFFKITTFCSLIICMYLIYMLVIIIKVFFRVSIIPNS